MRNANGFDFHPEVFMLPLFLWAFAAFVSGRRWAKALGLLALIAALGAKESAPVVAVGIGVAWALTGARWQGAALAAAGVALFLFDVKVVPAMFAASVAGSATCCSRRSRSRCTSSPRSSTSSGSGSCSGRWRRSASSRFSTGAPRSRRCRLT
jgi:hypothetical protein